MQTIADFETKLGYMPWILKSNLVEIFFPHVVKDINRFEAVSAAQTNWRVQQTDLKEQDLFASIQEATDPQTGLPLSSEELVAEAGLLIAAGSDTVTLGMTSCIFYLLHYPEAYERLKSEIRSTFHDGEEICRGSKLSSCRYLYACIDEALRLTPPVGGVLPREVLPGGMTVDGEFFPPGVDLAVPVYARHHDETCFPNPFVFNPSRWIVEGSTTADDVARAQATFHAFGRGRASCLGEKVAYLEMGLVLGRLTWFYDMRLEQGPRGRVGEGGETLGPWRRRKNEFQVFDNFTSSHEGPWVQFKRVRIV